jgi:hypothetical protein
MASPIVVNCGSEGTHFFSALDGTITWTTVGHLTGACDSVFDGSNGIGSAQKTQSLDGYGFTVGLPSGQSVLGLQVVASIKRTGSRAATVNGKLQINGSAKSPTGTNADGTAVNTTVANFTWGGSTDLWGFLTADLSQANINSNVEGTGPTFGCWFTGGGGTSTSVMQVDCVTLSVWYTASAATNTFRKTRSALGTRVGSRQVVGFRDDWTLRGGIYCRHRRVLVA